jgi:hypothetical protein
MWRLILALFVIGIASADMEITADPGIEIIVIPGPWPEEFNQDIQELDVGTIEPYDISGLMNGTIDLGLNITME